MPVISPLSRFLKHTANGIGWDIESEPYLCRCPVPPGNCVMFVRLQSPRVRVSSLRVLKQIL